MNLAHQFFSIFIFRALPCDFLLSEIDSNSTDEPTGFKLWSKWSIWEVKLIPWIEIMICISMKKAGFTNS